MKTKLLRVLAAGAFLFATSACNLAKQMRSGTPDLAGTITAQAGIIAQQGELTPALPTDLTPGTPKVTVSVATNCRTGPGGSFEIIGSMLEGMSAEVVGTYMNGSFWIIENPDAPGTCWLWGEYATVSGDTSGLPEMEAPPEPTGTTVPAANLVPGNLLLSPATPTCNVNFMVSVTITNNGTLATSSSGVVSVIATATIGGTQLGQVIGGFPILSPGQTYVVNMGLKITTFVAQQTITVVIDPSNSIPESSDGDNQRSISYTMQQGGCP
jgi:hypothetical protein